MRITLNDTFDIEIDESCTTLIRKVVVTGTGRGKHLVKQDNIGKVRDQYEGFFMSPRDAVRRAIEKCAAESAEMGDIQAYCAALEYNLKVMEKALEQFPDLAVVKRIMAKEADERARKQA